MLSFVEGDGDALAVTPLTPEGRAAVARAVAAMLPWPAAPAKKVKAKR